MLRNLKRSFLAIFAMLSLFYVSCGSKPDAEKKPTEESKKPEFTVKLDDIDLSKSIPGITRGTITATMKNADIDTVFFAVTGDAIVLDGEAVEASNNSASIGFTVVKKGDVKITASTLVDKEFYSEDYSVTIGMAEPSTGGLTITNISDITDCSAVVNFEADKDYEKYIVFATKDSVDTPYVFFDGNLTSIKVGDEEGETTCGFALDSVSRYTITILAVAIDSNGDYYYTKTVTEEFETITDIIPPKGVSDVSGTKDYYQMTLTWTNPSDADITKVKIYVYSGEELVSTEVVNKDNVKDFAANKKITYIVENLNHNTEYKFVFATFDENDNTDEEVNAEFVDTTLEDTIPPEFYGNDVSFDLNEMELSWTCEDSGVNAYVLEFGTDSIELESEINSYTFSSLPETVNLSAKDKAGNVTTITLSVPASLPEISSLDPLYTGSIKATIANILEGYTYNNQLILDSGVYGPNCSGNLAVIDGLDIGSTPAASLVSTITEGNGVTYNYEDSDLVNLNGKVSLVIWKLINGYTQDSKYYSLVTDIGEGFPADTNGGVCVIANDDEIKNNKFDYDRFIVRSSMGTGISLEFTNYKGESSGKYLGIDSTWNGKKGFRNDAFDWDGGAPKNYIGWAKDYQDTDAFKLNTTFYEASSTYTKDGHIGDGNFVTFQWAEDPERYLRGCCYHVNAFRTGSADSGVDGGEKLGGIDYAWYKEEYRFADELESAPSASEISVDAVEARRVDISWTDPADADFDYVEFIAEGMETVRVYAGTGSVSLKKLNPSTDYVVTAKWMDYFGMSSESTFSFTTEEDKTMVGRLAVSPKYTESVEVTWEDIVIEGDYTYRVNCVETAEYIDVPKGVQKAIFTGLTVGETYNFNVETRLGEEVCAVTENLPCEAKKVLWQLISGFQNRKIVPAVMNYTTSKVTEKNSYQVVASSFADGDGPDAVEGAIKYTYWLVYPSITGADGEFSLMASNSWGYESGYYAFIDTSNTNTLKNGSLISALWRGIASNNAMTNKVFIAELESIADQGLASFEEVSSSEAGWVWFYNETSNTTWQHAYCVFQGVSSVNDIACANIKYDISYPEDVEREIAEVTNPSAVGESTSRITITWEDPVSDTLDGVNITADETDLNGNAINLYVGAGSGVATITDLKEGTEYNFTIKVIDYYGESAGVTCSATTLVPAENAPSSVVLTQRWTGEIFVTWDVPVKEGEYSYKVTCGEEVVEWDPATEKKVRFTGLTSDTEYKVVVSASEDSGATWVDAEAQFITPVKVYKRLGSIYVRDVKGDKDNVYMESNGGGTMLFCQNGASGGFSSRYLVWPALDGSVTKTHTVTIAGEEISAEYDTFSLEAVTNTGADSGKYVNMYGLDAANTTDKVQFAETVVNMASLADITDKTKATFFLGYHSSGLSFRTVAENFTVGCDGSANNTEMFYLNDATELTCNDTMYAWCFDNY